MAGNASRKEKTKRNPAVMVFRFFLKILFWAGSLGYPFYVYYGLRNQERLGPVLYLLILAGLKLFLGGRDSRDINTVILVAAFLAGGGYFLKMSPEFMLFYPSMVSLGLLAFFGRTLIGDRVPLVERIASLKVPPEERTPFFRKYCRRVTEAWCVFFIFNGSVALLLALIANREYWMLYTGIISYMLMGLMFAGEFLIRMLCFMKARTDR